MSPRTPYAEALREAAHHVAACILAPSLPRRPAALPADDGGPRPAVLTRIETDGETRVEIVARLAGPAAVALGGRSPEVDEKDDTRAARDLLQRLGEPDREYLYRHEAEGFVRSHFLTIRALALQLLQAGTLDPRETSLIVDVAEGRAPRRVLDEYRAATHGAEG